MDIFSSYFRPKVLHCRLFSQCEPHHCAPSYPSTVLRGTQSNLIQVELANSILKCVLTILVKLKGYLTTSAGVNHFLLLSSARTKIPRFGRVCPDLSRQLVLNLRTFSQFYIKITHTNLKYNFFTIGT